MNADNPDAPPVTPENPAADDESRAAEAAETTPGDATALREALAQAEATAAENWNRYLRAVAELDNQRKRAARDVEAARM